LSAHGVGRSAKCQSPAGAPASDGAPGQSAPRRADVTSMLRWLWRDLAHEIAAVLERVRPVCVAQRWVCVGSSEGRVLTSLDGEDVGRRTHPADVRRGLLVRPCWTYQHECAWRIPFALCPLICPPCGPWTTSSSFPSVLGVAQDLCGCTSGEGASVHGQHMNEVTDDGSRSVRVGR
jgi:hypothetical protein